MIGVYVTVPIACFRKGMAREYLETEPLPPPATCYGFLLSMVGETDRRRHIGVRIAPMLLNQPSQSVVLRTVWRVKTKTLGGAGNTRPDYQQLLAPIHLVLWLESTNEESDGERLELRVARALDPARRGQLNRFGGLSLGESTHLVDEVSLFPLKSGEVPAEGRIFLRRDRGRLTLPVWVDHVGSTGTRHVTGDLTTQPLEAPHGDLVPWMPRIHPEGIQEDS